MRARSTLEIDLSDLDASRKIMDKFGDSPFPFVGQNEEGESTNTSISHDSIIMETYQANGWIRQNWLHYDGTREELFKGRWKQGAKAFTVTLEMEANSRHDILKMLDKVIDDNRTISFEIKDKGGSADDETC